MDDAPTVFNSKKQLIRIRLHLAFAKKSKKMVHPCILKLLVSSLLKLVQIVKWWIENKWSHVVIFIKRV